MNNIRSTLATVWRIAAPYFRSEDKWAGRALLAAVIAIELALVAIDVLLNQWNNRFYNALQEQELGQFRQGNRLFLRAGAFYVALAVYQLYLNQWLQIRWRRWMTTHYLGEWLHDANHYRMQLQGDAADNPDQRITDDVKLFVERTLDISIGLLSSIVTLASFVIILWGLSAAAPLHVFGSDFAIPGYLVWGALIYADLRNGADALDRLAAGQPRFPPAALRGRFPLQPGSGARKLRTDRAVAGRERRAAAAVGALRPRRRQLVRHHEPDQAADGVYQRAMRKPR